MNPREEIENMRRGPRYKEIDKKSFEGLCRIQCTLNEMCAFLECDNKTLENWCKREYGMKFSEIFSRKKSIGHVSLRRTLYRRGVEDGDSRILMFLAKNWLGMSDKQDVKVDGPIQVSPVKSVCDLSNLTEEELLQLRGIIGKTEGNAAMLTAIDAQIDLIRKQRFQDAREHYSSYMGLVYHGRWKRARHLDLLCDVLEEVESGDITRLIITMPPRHGKSMTVTESFPSWFIGRDPERRVIEVSYGSELAQRFGLNNRRKIEEFGKEIFGVEVSSDNASKTNWGLVGHSGGMISAGIGGSITGQGADLLIIDDPIKNRKEAESQTYRDSIWSEWQDTLSSRLHPGGRVVVIMTRWHEDDLVGRLMEQSALWRLINLPAIAEKEDILGREEGQVLWPEYGFDEKWAKQEKAMKGTRSWESLYQGHPRPSDGNLFRQSMFKRFKESGTSYKVEEKIYEKSSCKVFQTCDVAGSKKTSADYFVLGTFALCPNGELLVLDIFRERLEGPDQPILIKRKYDEYKPVLIGVESANMGLTLYQQLRRSGLPVIELKPDADKYTRAIPAAARYESGMIYHREGSYWQNDLEAELLAFPNGTHDDQVDVISYGVYMQSWGYLREKKRGGRALVLG